MCTNCDKKKDMATAERLAQATANYTGQPQQVYIETTWQGEIFDFEQLGLERERVVKIVKLEEGKYFGMFER